MIYLRKGDTAATPMYCYPNGVELITIIQVGKAYNKIWPPELDYTYTVRSFGLCWKLSVTVLINQFFCGYVNL